MMVKDSQLNQILIVVIMKNLVKGVTNLGIPEHILSRSNWLMNVYGEGYGKDWIYFPDGNGVPHYVSLKPSDDEYPQPQTRAVFSELEFKLYTNKNQEKYTILDEFAVPSDSSIDIDLSTLPLKIITHGWRSSTDSIAVASIKEAYLQARNVNIITIDWSYTAGSLFYHWVANETFSIGIEVASFLNSLSEQHNVTGDKIHLIGHSLGAHVMGIAAHHSNLTVNRITGLDPARPLFEYPSREDFEKLDVSDADFVDVIHTCGGVLGIESAIGTADFYPNSGIPPQPGCDTIPKILEACSHGRSYFYFAESITNPKAFLSHQCNDWDEYLVKRCGQYVYMGENVSRNISGKFYLQTNSKHPFGKIDTSSSPK